MAPVNKKESLVLLFGDLIVFYLSLYLMLVIRYFEMPSRELIALHTSPFTIIFVVWIGVFFIAGLYEKHTLILKSRMGSIILNAGIANSLLAVVFFYLIPYFGITPKTNLFIDLIISFILVATWRLYFFPKLERGVRENALLIGAGQEMRELQNEVNQNPRYGLHFTSFVDLDTVSDQGLEKEVLTQMEHADAFIVAADFENAKLTAHLPRLYPLIFSKVQFIDIHKLYEEIFDRIPLSLVQYSWFFEHVSGATQKSYDILKRGMDIALSFIIGALSLVLYPFIYLAIKLEDQGPVFFTHERVGQNGHVIRITKFRSLAVHNDEGGIAKNPQVTGVGRFLRKTRIDELPQLWNVLIGDLSLIGPRPEVPLLVKVYAKEIPYYNVRHLIKPGLSGWAQLYGEHGHGEAALDETRNKLSYDLYYIKNRSLMVDLKIALRTIKTLLSREGL